MIRFGRITGPGRRGQFQTVTSHCVRGLDDYDDHDTQSTRGRQGSDGEHLQLERRAAPRPAEA